LPRILVEEFIDDGERDGALNYRFWCFDGVPEVVNVSDYSRRIHQFYDTSWNKLDLHFRKASLIREVQKPKRFDQMLRVAAELSKGIDFVCVDLNNANGQIFFGELTFTPRGGDIQFKPEPWDIKLGQKWRI
jgi:predicted P-loop ATPase/GTPase